MAFNTVLCKKWMFRGRGGSTRCSSPSTHYRTCPQFKPVMRAEHTQPLMPGPTIAGTTAHRLKSPGLSLNIKYFCPWRAFPGKHHSEAWAGSRECLHCSRHEALPEVVAPRCSALDRPEGKGRAVPPCWWEKPRFTPRHGFQGDRNSQKGVGVWRAIFSRPLWKCTFSI